MKTKWIAAGPAVMQAPTDTHPAGFIIAHACNPYEGPTGAAERVAANVALLAAAPRLLAALEDLLAWTAEVDPDTDCDEIEEARRAIAAARNEAHA